MLGIPEILEHRAPWGGRDCRESLGFGALQGQKEKRESQGLQEWESRGPRGSLEPRVCLAFRGSWDLGGHLALLERRVPRALMGSKDRLDFQEPEGCWVKRERREKRVLRDFGWAAPGSRARRVLRVFLDHQAPLECLGFR
ncbi:hypothetical protein J1605_001083 [Eschrichtius robustus]|uniref:Uncharacterized protein n=1 Tax=Eschrichtius robustus TaxID=9764 RepID=A0AB34GQS1_ESCRO|nr:hypothetical protein J1605_001083 [Eschrichtius robustus]